MSATNSSSDKSFPPAARLATNAEIRLFLFALVAVQTLASLYKSLTQALQLATGVALGVWGSALGGLAQLDHQLGDGGAVQLVAFQVVAQFDQIAMDGLGPAPVGLLQIGFSLTDYLSPLLDGGPVQLAFQHINSRVYSRRYRPR